MLKDYVHQNKKKKLIVRIPITPLISTQIINKETTSLLLEDQDINGRKETDVGSMYQDQYDFKNETEL